ncbi:MULTISPECIES: CGNR zinc finger domain-containing protein [unclassified Streptomyces]|uniref:CGNR zinc finger domain-containing protein n=1 Tax=unclassified Streptomyces TaxID=2593676 RepID=UPI0023499E96|nr:CGNR zinc finger domain-containing protein [Streptomyces sp. M92]WCN05393.1 CGNR zinc finger domain-containing protein [Streptomyces sp. M92]
MSEYAPLVGEQPAIDLVNTRPSTGDLLATEVDLRSWWTLQAERFPEAPPPDLTTADLVPVLAVREHTARALGHVRRGEAPSAADLAGLNRAQRAAPAIRELVPDGTAVVTRLSREGRPGVRLAAFLAEAAAELLADPAVARVRACEAEDCVLLFLPQHPRRRWCSAGRCGNRVRVARHYQRHKPG